MATGPTNADDVWGNLGATYRLSDFRHGTRSQGAIATTTRDSGFIKVDNVVASTWSNDQKLFVLPSPCTGFGGTIPTIGT